MRNKTKIWFVIATVLVLVGLIIFGGAMTMLKWDFNKLSTVKYETNNYGINESYKNISIVTSTADIVFVPSEASDCKVVCHEQKNAKHSVSVKDDTLVIELVDSRKWYEYIGINLKTPSITVYLPRDVYSSLTIKENTGDVEIPKYFQFKSIDISTSTGDVTSYATALEDIKIKTSTGDIKVKNISARTLELSVSTGKVTASEVNLEGDLKISVSTGRTDITNIGCKNLFSNGNTGSIRLNNVIAKEKFSIERTTGNVTFEACDATEIFVRTDTGSVTGALLSEKIFITKTDTGSINVPNSITGGRCEITTDTGNIKITVD